MAYKKYIQKNGKLYGPYIYHSKRVDGKVISEYYGSKGIEWGNYKKILFIFAGIFLMAALIYFFAFSNHNKITGGVVLGVDTSYEAGKSLEGVLKFSLKEGELIPESSKVVIENSGKTYEFILKNVLDETSLEGNYYAYGKEIQGEGLGYGIEGEKVIYPDVEFVLQVYSESGAGGETTPEEIPQNITEVPEVISEANVSSNEVISEEVIPNSEIVSVETTQEVIPSESIESIPIEPAPETTTEASSTSPITGGVVKNSGGFFASFFGLTGMVSMNLENEIGGVTSKNKPFIYELKEGETAELIPKSVKTNGKELEDNIVSLKFEGSNAIVTTDYSEIEKGYGKDYIGNKEKVISLDLSNLNLSLEKGDLIIKLVYGENELIHLTTLLEEGKTTSNETIVDIKESEESNITSIEVNKLNESIIEINQTINKSINFSFEDIGDFLTPEEKEILVNEFGNITLENTKSELFKERIIIGYNFSKYYVEYSYDSSLSKETLDVQMEKDRIKFLKDIANSVSRKEMPPKNMEEFNKSYNF